MSESFTLKVSELLKILNKMNQDGMDFVKFLPLEEDYIEDEIIPACLSISGIKTNDYIQVDYDEIELVDTDF